MSKNKTFFNEHIAELDGVRGMACIMVISLHYFIGIVQLDQQSWLSHLRSAIQPFLIGGVDLFFVLSGVLISGILMDHKESDSYFKTFWSRRIARIFPVYFLLLLTYILLLEFRSNHEASFLDIWLFKNPLPIWSYATFTQSIPMAELGDGGARWIGVTWSLAVEEQFYWFLPPLVYWLSRKNVVLMAIVAIFISPFIRTLAWTQLNWFASYCLLPCRMDTLMWGVLVACAIRNTQYQH